MANDHGMKIYFEFLNDALAIPQSMEKLLTDAGFVDVQVSR